MRGRRSTLILAVPAIAATVFALAGCGGRDDATDAGSTTGAASPSAIAVPSFDPDDAVIALSDLPSGWAVEPDDDNDYSELCGLGGPASLIGGTGADRADAQFAEGGDSPVLANAVSAYVPGEANVVFDQAKEIVAGCASLESGGTTYEVTPVSFPEQGDESIPLLVSTEFRGYTIRLYLVITRVADGITALLYGGLAPDVAEAERYVGLAVTKLGRAQGSAP